MGYIIVDEEKFKENVYRWNSESYRNSAFMDLRNAQVDCSHMLEALQQAKKNIDAEIKKLEAKKNDIGLLMNYAK